MKIPWSFLENDNIETFDKLSQDTLVEFWFLDTWYRHKFNSVSELPYLKLAIYLHWSLIILFPFLQSREVKKDVYRNKEKNREITKTLRIAHYNIDEIVLKNTSLNNR